MAMAVVFSGAWAPLNRSWFILDYRKVDGCDYVHVEFYGALELAERLDVIGKVYVLFSIEKPLPLALSLCRA